MMIHSAFFVHSMRIRSKHSVSLVVSCQWLIMDLNSLNANANLEPC